MLIPNGGFLEQNNAARRKIAFLQPPPVHGSRVYAEGQAGIDSRTKRGHVCARKNFKDHVGDCCADRLVCIGISPDNATADISFKKTVDRGGGSFSDRGSHISWNEAFAF